jgi:DNA-binding NarL/FixJ family response regulator
MARERSEPTDATQRSCLLRILAVEDDAAVLPHWARLLSGRASLVGVATLSEAWRRTDANVWCSDPFDHVFLDLRLPDGNGLDLIDRLDVLPDKPGIAVITAHLDASIALQLHGRCAVIIPKPADRQVLHGILDVLEADKAGISVVANFARRHRLSPQEARLLNAAIREACDEEASDILGCTPGTVRSYWSRIFSKVGCHSQRDVVARLFRFAAEPQGYGMHHDQPARGEPQRG